MTPGGGGGRRSSFSVYGLAALCACGFAVFASSGAIADEVYGRVVVGGNPAHGGTLEFRREGSSTGTIVVGIAADGGYRVFLEPGRYAVRLKEPSRAQPVGVTSLPAPVRQDLVFP
jgi:hypothetical protein